MRQVRIKVYGWTGFPREFRGVQCRLIMAATSMKRISELTDCSLYYLRGWASETSNAKELQVALAEPEQKFACPLNDRSAEYKRVTNR